MYVEEVRKYLLENSKTEQDDYCLEFNTSNFNIDIYPKLKKIIDGKNYNLKLFSYNPYVHNQLILYKPLLSPSNIITCMFRPDRTNVPIGCDIHDCFGEEEHINTYYFSLEELKNKLKDYMETRLISYIEKAEKLYPTYEKEYNIHTQIVKLNNEIIEKKKALDEMKKKYSLMLKRHFKMNKDFK